MKTYDPRMEWSTLKDVWKKILAKWWFTMVEIKEKGHTFKNKIQAFHTSHTWSVSSFWEISPQEIIPLLLEISKFFIRIRSKQQVLNINPFIISGYLANTCLLKGVSSNAYCTTSCSQLPTLNLLADVALNDGKPHQELSHVVTPLKYWRSTLQKSNELIPKLASI